MMKEGGLSLAHTTIIRVYMMKKGQHHRQVESAQNEVEFIHTLFGIAS